MPIEQVVEPNRQHLEVTIARADRVAVGEAKGTSRHREARVALAKEIVPDFGRPVGRKSIFDACAYQPATVGILFEPLIEAPVVTLVTVNSLVPTQPAPLLA